MITKRVKDKDFVLNSLLNGEDIEDYLGRKKLREYAHFTNQNDISEINSELEQMKSIENQVKGMKSNIVKNLYKKVNGILRLRTKEEQEDDFAMQLLNQQS